MFSSVEDVIQQLSDQEYICDKQIATVVFLAQQLDKPVVGGLPSARPSSPRSSRRPSVAR